MKMGVLKVVPVQISTQKQHKPTTKPTKNNNTHTNKKPVPVQLSTHPFSHHLKISHAIKPVPKPIPSAQRTIWSSQTQATRWNDTAAALTNQPSLSERRYKMTKN